MAELLTGTQSPTGFSVICLGQVSVESVTASCRKLALQALNYRDPGRSVGANAGVSALFCVAGVVVLMDGFR